jgi:hypothetical protein
MFNTAVAKDCSFTKKEILWHCNGKQFDGIPMVAIGRMRFRCRQGPNVHHKNVQTDLVCT